MGKGIDQARESAPEHAALIDQLKEQLLIVFLRRMGGEVVIPVAEIDDTSRHSLAFSIDQERNFHFEIVPKQGS